MEGVDLIWLALVAWLGGVLLATVGGLNALAKGQKWSWPVYGVSVIVALFSGASYAAIATQEEGVPFALALLLALVWGCGNEGVANSGLKLVLNKLNATASTTSTSTPST